MDEHASQLSLRLSCCDHTPCGVRSRVQLCRGGATLASHIPNDAQPKTATRAAQTGVHQLATLRADAGVRKSARVILSRACRAPSARRLEMTTQLLQQRLYLRLHEPLDRSRDAATVGHESKTQLAPGLLRKLIRARDLRC